MYRVNSTVSCFFGCFGMLLLLLSLLLAPESRALANGGTCGTGCDPSFNCLGNLISDCGASPNCDTDKDGCDGCKCTKFTDPTPAICTCLVPQ